MTLTAQALLSLSFLACTPRQQDSIFVAEDRKKATCVLCADEEAAGFIGTTILWRLPASFCFLNSPCALYPLYLAWSLVAADVGRLSQSLFVYLLLKPKPIPTHPARACISQKHPLLRKASWGDGWIFWFCWKENSAVYCGSSICLLCGYSRDLTVPFYTRWASSPDVEPALPPHLQASRSSEARWPDTAVCTCTVRRAEFFSFKRPGSRKLRLWWPSYLFRKTSNLRLYANPARLTRRCSMSPRYFTWCLISTSSNWPVSESRPDSQSRTPETCTAARACLLAYLDAWIRWTSGSGCTRPPWPRGSPSASAGCSWTGSPPTDTRRRSQQLGLNSCPVRYTWPGGDRVRLVLTETVNGNALSPWSFIYFKDYHDLHWVLGFNQFG